MKLCAFANAPNLNQGHRYLSYVSSDNLWHRTWQEYMKKNKTAVVPPQQGDYLAAGENKSKIFILSLEVVLISKKKFWNLKIDHSVNPLRCLPRINWKMHKEETRWICKGCRWVWQWGDDAVKVSELCTLCTFVGHVCFLSLSGFLGFLWPKFNISD